MNTQLRERLICADRNRGRLMATQQAIWNLHLSLDDPSVLNLAYAFLAEGPLTLRAFEAALQGIIDRHEPLRTSYLAEGNRAVGHVERVAKFQLQYLDLTNDHTEEKKQETIRRIFQEVSRPFDLRHVPMIRASVLKLNLERHIIAICFHHLAADGWSLDVFGRECSLLYAAELEGQPCRLSPLSRQCVDEAESEMAWLESPAAKVERSWWEYYLEGLPVSCLHFEIPSASQRMRRRVIEINQDILNDLSRLGAQQEATLFIVLLGLFSSALSRSTGYFEVVVGTLTANRWSLDSTRMMGAHYNTTLLRLRISPDDLLTEVVECARQVAGQVFERSLPFAEIGVIASHYAGVNTSCAPAVMFLMDKHPLNKLSLKGAELSSLLFSPSNQLKIDQGVLTDEILTAPGGQLIIFIREGGGSSTLSVLSRDSAPWDVPAIIGGFFDAISLFLSDPQAKTGDIDPYAPDFNSLRPAHKTEGILPVEALSPITVFQNNCYLEKS